jgi:vancomycin resistance protein VanJ
MDVPVSESRRGPAGSPARTRADRRALAWRAIVGLAWLYPLSLLAVIAAFRFIGERWWVTTVAMYLPRFGFGLPLPVLLVALTVIGGWRQLWIVLGTSVPLLLVLMGLVLPWPVHANPSAPTLRVLSYNVNTESAGADAIVQVIDGYSPDVVFLEEHGNSEAIGTLLQARYASVRVAGQFVVASRFPISSKFDPEKLPYEGRMRSPRWLEEVIETPLGPIAFFEVHPMSPRDGLNAVRGLRHDIKMAIGLTEDGEDIVKNNSGLRALQVADFAGAAEQELEKEKLPVIIAGDTNLPGLSYVLHHSLSGFQDGFSKAGWGFGYTFPVGKRFSWMRIDRILASDDLRFVRFQVGRSLASDHECVVADLQRAP